MLKRSVISLIFILGTMSTAFCQDAESAWNRLCPQILSLIKAPQFPAKEYNIVDFGAVASDSTRSNDVAINRAIEVCSARGGGRVVVPQGIWYTSGIELLSNVDLHLQRGAVLLFLTDANLYKTVLTRWEGVDCYNIQPLIYAFDQTNIAITGEGIIDGGATRNDWWAKCGSPRYGWKEGMVSQRTGRPKLMSWNNDNIPVGQRRLGVDDGMRPQLINLYKCTNILISGVTLLRSPFWVIHPLMCENLTVRGVRIENDGPNGDGCDPESCRNVLIEDCFFDTGDDCIAIKSGRNNDGLRWNVPSENIVVRNCRMQNGHGGVVIGSEISGGYRNLFVENCIMESPKLDRVIRIKTSNCRGGVIENIYVRNIEVGECNEAVLKINLNYESNEVCSNRTNWPVVDNVCLENVTSRKSKLGVFIIAFDDRTNVSNINLSNCTFDNVADGNLITGRVNGLSCNNLKINGSKVDLSTLVTQ